MIKLFSRQTDREDSPVPATTAPTGAATTAATATTTAATSATDDDDLRSIPVPEAPYDYAHFSRLAGPTTEPSTVTTPTATTATTTTTAPGATHPYRVQYRSLLRREPHRLRAALLLLAAPVVEAVLLVWLLLPGHWPVRPGETHTWLLVGDKVMVGIIAVVEVFRLVNVVSNTHATLVARDPVPVTPEAGTRVAFLTTCVPGKEPPEMVRATLTAALAVRHDGPYDVWLLDEGNDPAMRALCGELGAYHFSRRGIERWNQPKGRFRAKTKHGNYNSWLQSHGADYDFWVSVDTDHVPLPELCERMLGYFRDPDVAFVVGPQVYGNYRSSGSAVTKFSESQQFLFHALIQRAGNRYGAPMFVGTNNAVRITALQSIGGLYDSITEDMATGLEFHRRRNPATGARWKSVYTPDVLAVGEGPSSWTDFFSQQLRWSRGTYETLLTQYWRAVWRLSPGRLLNYTLMVCFYPMAALTWLLGGVSSVLYLGFGASGVHVSSEIWMMLYSDAAALQVLLYTWNRKHNVSPHEPAGSSGVAGMVMSALCGPIYAASFLQAALRRRSRFVVTPKGDSASPDRLSTFRIHLFWALVFGGAVTASFFTGHDHAAMRTWACLALFLSLLPMLVLAADAVRRRRARPTSTLSVTGVTPAPAATPRVPPQGRTAPTGSPTGTAPAATAPAATAPTAR
ncbi:cellulose synthase catalytic subunit [Kitasatospora sp. CM 4170]|uniref:Cellulose synthase catalytic subunit n=1 Tax=Kitasatospora aburaviensis TaxID=67265 RepID=A0ABW1ERY9_9ACTN|nr:cellulose synthase catalytic subunit [Kitasatospora sp. CM 4170]WNM45928.1 cellulose synthase catalytic subunit [Kitasatospora sp. CM 4170]